MSNDFVQGDYTFYIRPMDPFKALDLLGDLQKAFLPALGAAMGKVQQAGGDAEVSMSGLLSREMDINKGLSSLSEAINGVKLTDFLQRILNTDYISYSRNSEAAKRLDKSALMSIYQGNLSGMFALAWKVLQVNYADFFTIIPGLTGGEQGEKSET